MPNRYLTSYFSSFYPKRSSLLGRLFFRSGEYNRRSIVRQWLPRTNNIHILDAGCGDGLFLASLLSGTPKKVQLEDLVSDYVKSACHNLVGLAETVDGTACDVLKCDDVKYDVVIAIGVLDYQKDWKHALLMLANRSHGILIATLPRANHPRNMLRYAWFKLWGMHLSLLNRLTLTTGLQEIGLPFEIQSTHLELFVRINCK